MTPYARYGIYTLLSGVAAIALFGNAVMKNAGGPPYNTGAPGEKTCSGGEGGNACHGNNTAQAYLSDNTGPGTPSIVFGGGINYYVPGQTYTVKPTITHPVRNRFGFQLVALKNGSNANIGTLSLTDTMKMRLQRPTWGCCQDRWYVMHKFDGTFPVTPNVGEWTFNWTAPPANEGPINFYAAFNAANNNGVNDSLDETYTTSLTIYPSATGVREDRMFDASVSVFPNPAAGRFLVRYTLAAPSAVTATLSDLKGSRSALLFSGTLGEGIRTLTSGPPEAFPPGVYLLTISSDDGVARRKVVLQGR